MLSFFRYYQFDEVVIREILGKKLSQRNRKDLDDVSEKTKTHIKKCRRQVNVAADIRDQSQLAAI